MTTAFPIAARTARHSVQWLLPLFLVSLVVLNWGRWSGWSIEGLKLYVTQPIMQTTLYDFAWVLAVLTVFIHRDAKKHHLRYWYIFPTFPVMPAVGLLLYVWLRHRSLSKLGNVPPLGS
jgi:hypothetical protein